MITHRFLLPVLGLFGVSLTRAAEPSFDAWADNFAEEWVRLNPQLATRTQYFSGEEQDAIDRKYGFAEED